MRVVEANWRIDVNLLHEGPEAENAAKYWDCRADVRGRIVWEHKISVLFGTINSRESAVVAAQHAVATMNGPDCAGCGSRLGGVVVASRQAAAARLSTNGSRLCQHCKDAKTAAAAGHRDRVEGWITSYTAPLPAELRTLAQVLLLDHFTQLGPFKDRRLRGRLLLDAGLSATEVGELLDLGIIRPAAAVTPGSVEFHEEGISYRPFEIDWHPAGDGTLEDRFEAVERLAAAELRDALDKFPDEVRSRCRESIVWEAERYLVMQLSGRGFDEPTESQMARFRESVSNAWSDLSLGVLYRAIYQGCAKAADSKAQFPQMGRAHVTGAAVNGVLDALPKYISGQWNRDPFTAHRRLPLTTRSVTLFRTMLDLDPMSAVEEDVARVLGIEARPFPPPQEILDAARDVYDICRRSMPEENAFVAAIASLDLLLPYYDNDTIDTARARFTGERTASRLSEPDDQQVDRNQTET